jgi:hypothetical protein
MAIVVGCALLLLGGLAATVLWGGLDVQIPELPRSDERLPVALVLRRYVWTVSLLVWVTFLSGLFIVGPAARLAMRLLAVTAGAGAQGRRTEADEIVGRISSGGTFGILVFVGVFGALIGTVAFLVLRRWLPRGRSGGLILGALLLVIVGSRVEPLRSGNPDFDLVGPGWLSIVVFSAMALVTGLAVQAFAGRVSRSLPLPGTTARKILPHVVLILLVAGFAPLLVAVAGGLVTLALSRTPVARVFRSRAVSIAGWVAASVAVAIALPGFVSSVVDIAGRGP